ncbi:hypothetical protein EV178_001646 [Coemansia sp. RSA 1646]|nr:hypothetical protein EV178_001646 [Coemansia sp. RSA 1646]KAJ2091314.1 hypothetical protein IW138_002013 [Coemansia sp. RSA 986]
MTTTKNINWEISVLEAKTGDGKSLRKAIAREAKRKRKEKEASGVAADVAAPVPASEEANKDNESPTNTTDAPEQNNEEKDQVDPNQEKLNRLRIEKARRALHQRRRIFHSMAKKVLSLEKVKRQRRIKRASLVLNNPETKEEAGVAKRDIDENKEILEQVVPIKVDDLVECMAFKFFKRSPCIRESLGEYKPEPHIAELLANKAAMRMLNDIKAVNVIKAAVLAVEALIKGAPKKAAKLAKKEARTLRKNEKAAAKQEALKNRFASKKGKPSKDFSSGSDSEANTKSTFVSTLARFDSDDDTVSAGPKKRKAASNDDYYSGEEDDAAFNKIYGTSEQRNRPGQRARRQKFEKMYGDEANHIKLRQKDKKTKRSFNYSNASTSQSAHKQDADSDKLHPSWEAKKKQKEIMEQAKNVKGTKIVFG